MTETRDVAIYGAEELRRHVVLSDASLRAVEQAFTWLAEGRASMPPVMHISVGQRGDVDIKSAYVEGEERFAVKIASGFFGNLEQGLPSGSGLMVVLSSRTGFCEAVLLDQGYLTYLRTALAGAVAAKHLAPSQLHTVGVVGSGVQAHMQVQALRLVRGFERLLVWSRQAAHAERYQEQMLAELGGSVEVQVVPDLEVLTRQSQCVLCTTPARQPLLRADWLHPGLHITAMGSDLPGKQELESEILSAADLVVCDRRQQAVELGEMQHWQQARAQDAVELGEITSGRSPGRSEQEQITVCDLTGVGVQDTAISLFALERMAAAV